MAHTSEMDLLFAKTDLGETCWMLCKDGHMKAVSIGFRALDGYEEVKNGVRVFIITKIELFEISLVAVGANRRALAKSILKDLGFEPEDVTRSETDSLETFKESLCQSVKSVVKDFRDEILSELDDIKSLLIPDSDVDLSEPAPKDDPSDIYDLGHSFTQKLKTAFSPSKEN